MTGDLLTDDDLKTERATEPPKRWFNWSASVNDAVYECSCGRDVRVRAGVARLPHCPTAHPSKDIAESKALADMQDVGRALYWIYLGAFPEGERP